MSMSAVRSFLERMLFRQEEPILRPMDHPDFLTTAIGKRAEFARDLLNSPYFTETIQMMNEEVVQEIAATDPLDTDRLTVLRLRLGTISDFSFRLSTFLDEREQLEFEEYEKEQRRRTGNAVEAA